MAMRMLGRSVSRRFSTGGGKILSEEEKAAENIYIKGSKPKEQLASSTEIESAESATDAKPSVGSTSSTTSGVYRNYAIYAAVGTSCAALGWYLNGSA
ncbi:hypothetical protein MKX03_004778 [Papaver bracteatum]|nr:hypothetical protein MKX03_004778 [Papaver bracteatum]